MPTREPSSTSFFAKVPSMFPKEEATSSSDPKDSKEPNPSPIPDETQHGGTAEIFAPKEEDTVHKEPDATKESAGEKMATLAPEAGKEDKPTDSKPANEEKSEPATEEKSKPATDEKPKDAEDKPKGPAGGYDATPIVHRPPGYTVKITFHRATALPMGDALTLSSDPYLLAELKTDLPQRHKEDPVLRFRSRTIFKSTNPAWEEPWIIENIPATGFTLKARIYDEDRGDQDDRLGNAHVSVGRIDEKWEGITDQPYKIKKRMGSKRAYLLRAIAVCFSQAEEMSGRLHISVEVLGRSPGNEGGRAFTVGPNYWFRHYSPLLGRIVGSKTAADDPDEHDVEKTKSQAQNQNSPSSSTEKKESPPIPGTQILNKPNRHKKKKNVMKYNFQANQIQLKGPVPPELYHRYVEFRPFIKSLFTAKGIRGILMSKALHHQHAQVYSFDGTTKYGVFDGPCEGLTQRFLELCHHGEDGRMFTYVMTLDALMRFTETGKEFGIDLLSKHTMHSDASNYIAYSGEFFIRRRHEKHDKRSKHQHSDSESSSSSVAPPPLNDADVLSSEQETNENEKADESPTAEEPGEAVEKPKPGPEAAINQPLSHFELVIDNDSGTYRPNAALLPLLRKFLSSNFPGISIATLDCQKDADLMGRLKKEQRDKKQRARERDGRRIFYVQPGSVSSSNTSVSSSDASRLSRNISRDAEEEAHGKAAPTKTDQIATGNAALGAAGKSKGGAPAEQTSSQPAAAGPEGEAKHRIAEAALPYVHNDKVRDAITKE